MIRAFLAVLFVLAAFVVLVALSGDPGRASLIWIGWRLDTSAAVAALLIGLSTLLAMGFWRLALWIAEAPRRAARARLESRRKQAAEVLSRGFLAIAAGEGSDARRLAQKAADLADETPALVRLLAAQAAEAAGDLEAARVAYGAMLGFPEMRLAGHRGLMSIATAAGDRAAALKHARDAYDLTRTARWAWRVLFEAELEAGNWTEALALVDGALQRKIVTPVVAERARAALFTATAAGYETATDPKKHDQAVDFAVKAAKLAPAFAPGSVIAARLLAEVGKLGKAEDAIEQAWREAPHPALWLAWRDLRTDETPRERARRLQTLIDANPEHRESRILAVEQALLAADRPGLKAAVDQLSDEAPTARLCGLNARAAVMLGRGDEARAWIARGSTAAQEPDWSDLDPEGRAFAYQQADWSRLVSTWTETGELLHPRFERHEPALSDLPELPSTYEASAPFVSAAESAAGYVHLTDDPGFADALAGPAPEPEPAPAKPARRRRAASLGKGSAG